MKKRHQKEHAESKGNNDGNDIDNDKGFDLREGAARDDSDSDDVDINDATQHQHSHTNNEALPIATKKKVRKLKLSSTEDFNAKLKKRGIVYLARIPPRMGPAKVKTLLSEFGSISRVYLAEEDKTVRKKRRKAGGSGGKRYTEGWVEFESKKAAKLVGETLNMSRVAHQKGSVHYDDMWSLKYLRGFKWSHLTEKVAYERRVREQKLRVEMMEVRRENAMYMAQVEAGKKLDHIEERRKKKKETEGGKEDIGGVEGSLPKKMKSIRQKKPFEAENRLTAKSAILGSLI